MTFKSPFAAATILTHHEPVATDLIFGDTLGVDCGYKRAKIVVGRNSLVIDFFVSSQTKHWLINFGMLSEEGSHAHSYVILLQLK